PAQPLEDLLVVVEGVLLPAGELVPAEGLRGSRRRGGRVLRPGDDAPSGVPALAVELLGGIPLLDGGDVAGSLVEAGVGVADHVAGPEGRVVVDPEDAGVGLQLDRARRRVDADRRGDLGANGGERRAQAVHEGLGRARLVVVVRQPVAVAVPDVPDVDHTVAVLVGDGVAEVQGRDRVGPAGRVDRVLVDVAAVLRGEPELVAPARIGARDAGTPAAGFPHVDEVRADPLAATRLDRVLG